MFNLSVVRYLFYQTCKLLFPLLTRHYLAMSNHCKYMGYSFTCVIVTVEITVSFLYLQITERGERDPWFSKNIERTSKGLRTQFGKIDEDQVNFGAWYLCQGQQSQMRFSILYGHAQRIPNGSKSRPRISNAHLLSSTLLGTNKLTLT